MIAFCIGGLFHSAALAQTSSQLDQYRELSQTLDSLERVRTFSSEEEKALMLQRVDILASMVKCAPSWQMRRVCAERLADSLNIAILNGAEREGLSRLSQTTRDFRDLDDLETVAFLEYTQINSRYYLSVQEGTDLHYFERLEAKRLEQLAEFVMKYRNCPRIVNALLDLAGADERAGRYDDAMGKYERVIHDFPVFDESRIARGAIDRITSTGKTIDVRGTSARGESVNLADYRGKDVLLCFTTRELLQGDPSFLSELQKAHEAFAQNRFTVVCVSLEDLRERPKGTECEKYCFPWPDILQINQRSGNGLATRFGILQMPMVFLIDIEGKVVKQLIGRVDLVKEIEQYLHSPPASQHEPPLHSGTEECMMKNRELRCKQSKQDGVRTSPERLAG